MEPGTRFGQYVILERIAHGGMAEVFKAKAVGEAGFERFVAIKRLHREYASDPELVAMLQDEARLCSVLVHRNICQVFDLGRVGDAYYIAMEFVDGRDLADVMRRAKKVFPRTLPYPAVYYIMREVLEGLDYAHSKKDAAGRPLNIIHRDVSPQNVIVSFEGEVKIIDFGIAKARVQSHRTEAGVIKGKFRYMSPEQARGEPVDHRSDIFAAGILFYELVLGRPHSRGLTDMQVLLRLQRGELEPLDQLVPDLPPQVNAIIEKALAPHPAQRFQSAGEFRRALDAYCRTEGLDFDRQAMAQLMVQLFPEARSRPPPVPREAPGRQTLAELQEALGPGTVELDIEDVLVEESVMAQGRIGRLRARPVAPASEGPPVSPDPRDATEVSVTVAETPAGRLDLPPAEPAGPPEGTRDPESAPLPSTSTQRVRRLGRMLSRLLGTLLGMAILAGLAAGGYVLYRRAKRARRVRVVRTETPARVRATLHVSSDPQGAWILVDGKQTGYRTPARFAVESDGTVRLELRLDGYEPWRREVPVGNGDVVPLEARLVPIGARRPGRRWRRRHRPRARVAGRPEPAGVRQARPEPEKPEPPREEAFGLPGRVEVRANKPAWVYVNGRRMDNTPAVLELRPGRYTVWVRVGGKYRSKAQVVQVRSGARILLNFQVP